jgi:hypothetical protein
MGDHNDDPSRRAFVKKAAYVAPVIVTLEAMPVFASNGSDWSKAAKEAAKDAEKAAKDPRKRLRRKLKRLRRKPLRTQRSKQERQIPAFGNEARPSV